MTISKGQMDALGAYTRKQFEQRLAEYIQDKFPGKTKDSTIDEIMILVRKSIEKAEYYGIDHEDDIRRFIEYIMIYGSHMDTDEKSRWIGDILRQMDLGGALKMDLLDRRELQMLRRQT